MKLSLAFSFVVLLIFPSAVGVCAVSVPNDCSCTRVPIVKAATPPSDVQPQRSGFLFDTYSGPMAVFGSRNIIAGHDKPTIAGLSGTRIEVSSRAGLLTSSPNFVSDLSFMELTGTARGHTVRFDFAGTQATLPDAPASMSIAFVDPPITSSSPVDKTLPGVHPLIVGNATPKSGGSSHSLIAPIESMDPALLFGANGDGFTTIDAVVPEANTLHYGLLGLCLLIAKFRWDGTRDRRIHREMNRRDVF